MARRTSSSVNPRTTTARSARSPRTGAPSRPQSVPVARTARSGASRAGARPVAPASRSTVSSVRLGDLPRTAPSARTSRPAPKRSGLFRALVVLAIVAVIAGGAYAVLFFTPVFTITKVEVNGADHLTSEEMAVLAAVPQGTTLLTVDTAGIENSVVRDAWVQSVHVERHFPDTLEIVVTERTIAAVVDVVADNAKVTQHWAIASDGMWLMEIPDQDSELGQMISPQIYEDAAKVLHITDVPFGLTPEVGTYCTDGNVNNALAILDGLSTELADRIRTVSATDAQSTLLTLDDGVQIAFGTADDIRDKERICLKIMEENRGTVAYINVRVVDRPTWRAV